MKTFDLPTKFGTVFFKVNGINEIYVSDNKRIDFKDVWADIVIRGKNHKNLHLRFGLLPDGTLDGRTYDFDGNTPCFVSSKANNTYFKVRAVHLSEGSRESFSIKDSSDAAKTALYDEIKIKLNEFFKNNEDLIESEFVLRATEQRQKRMDELNQEIAELERQLKEKNDELFSLAL